MNFWMEILPQNQPEKFSDQDVVFKIRERLFQTSILFLDGVTLFLILFYIATGNPEFNPIGLWQLGFGLFTSLIVTVARRTSLLLRSIYLLALLYGAGFLSIINVGITGSSLLFLLTFSVFSGLLLGQRGGLIGLGVSILTLIGFESAIVFGILSPHISLEIADLSNPFLWANFGVHYLALAGLLMTGFSIIQSGLLINIKERETLYMETQEKHHQLERDFEYRSIDLNRRLAQIKVVSEINHTISTNHYNSDSLQSFADLIAQSLDLYYVGIFMIDPSRQFAVLNAGSGTAGRKMMANGHRLAIGGLSMIGGCVASQQARIALNVNLESNRYINPYLPETQSELALPIMSPTSILGAMSIQSVFSEAFDQTDISILQSIADAIGVAIDNANLIEKSRKDIQEISRLNRSFIQSTWKEQLAIHGKLQYHYKNTSILPNTKSLNPMLQRPILLRGQTIGALSISGLNSSSQEDLEFIDTILSQMSLSLENVRLLEETQRQAAHQEKVNSFSAKLAKAPRIEDILQIAIRELGQISSVEEVFIQLSQPSDSNTESSMVEREGLA